MILFPEWFLAAIVYVGIGITALGAALLVALLVRDARRGRLW